MALGTLARGRRVDIVIGLVCGEGGINTAAMYKDTLVQHERERERERVTLGGRASNAVIGRCTSRCRHERINRRIAHDRRDREHPREKCTDNRRETRQEAVRGSALAKALPWTWSCGWKVEQTVLFSSKQPAPAYIRAASQ